MTLMPGSSDPTPQQDSTQASEHDDDPNHGHIISPSADGSNPWEDGIKLARDYDNEMCAMLKDELENLLLFAALFSAIITAFTVVSYTWLQPNNTNNPSPVSRPIAVQINALWFTSLAVSLSASSIGILCMQWVRQYRRWKTRMDKRTAALRRQRFEGFLHWHVPNIVAALPVILQFALVLFGIGLSRLLWSLNHTVAICFTTVSGLSLAFIVGTTLAPVVQWLLKKRLSKWWKSQCPYQSPQAWLAYCIAWALTFGKRKFDCNWEEFDLTWLVPSAQASVSRYETDFLREELCWLDREFGDNTTAIKTRARALRQLSFEAAQGVVKTLFKTLELDPGVVDEVCDSEFNSAEGVRNFKHLKVWYLWGHAQIHPSLDDAYMEARIDFMSEVPTKKINLPGRARARHLDVQCLVKDPFLVPRFLHCLKVMVRHERLSKPASEEIWDIVGDLLEYSIRHDYMTYVPALSRLFKAIHEYLKADGPIVATQTKPAGAVRSMSLGVPPSLRNTVEHMLSGLNFFFALHADQKIGHLDATNSDHMEPLRELIAFLDRMVQWADIETPIPADGGGEPSTPPRPTHSPTTGPPLGGVLVNMSPDPTVPTEKDPKTKWHDLVDVLKKWSLPKDHPYNVQRRLDHENSASHSAGSSGRRSGGVDPDVAVAGNGEPPGLERPDGEDGGNLSGVAPSSGSTLD